MSIDRFIEKAQVHLPHIVSIPADILTRGENFYEYLTLYGFDAFPNASSEYKGGLWTARATVRGYVFLFKDLDTANEFKLMYGAEEFISKAKAILPYTVRISANVYLTEIEDISDYLASFSADAFPRLYAQYNGGVWTGIMDGDEYVFLFKDEQTAIHFKLRYSGRCRLSGRRSRRPSPMRSP